MDYIFLSSIANTSARSLVLSYDITCQWHWNFLKRLKEMPHHLQFHIMPKLQFLIPKFHLPPHHPECHAPFSFNYAPGIGRTDGKGVECNWSWLNGAAGSTSQMGPGSRHNTLDNIIGFFNYQKVMQFGVYFVWKVSNLMLTRNTQEPLFFDSLSL